MKNKIYCLVTTLILVLSVLSHPNPLYSQTGSLLVTCNVPGAEVYLGPNRVGRISREGVFFVGRLKTGSYILKIRKSGYVDVERRIEIRRGVTTSVRITLQIQKAQKADIFINCNVGEADIYLDGQYIGRTSYEGNFFKKGVPIGRHSLVLKKDGYQKVERNFEIKNANIGTTLSFKIELHPKTGGINWWIFLILLIAIGTLVLIFTLFKVIASFKQIKLRFDNYIIKEIIGRGGMSTIYKAEDLLDGREVALKIMDDRLLGDRDLVNKFYREGHGLAKINQKFPQAPVVKVYRFGRENGSPTGRPFIAMELLKGPSLLTLMNRKKRFSLSFIINLIKQVAEALAAAHELKIYHRDVSPDNIIIIRNNPDYPLIKLIDFGVAKHEYIDIGTLDGSISGKPPYMSPEQCRGEKVDGRSDIYSLGIIFYTLLAGRPPFVSKNPLEVMYFHEHHPVPPLPNQVPEAIRKVVYKMLEKDKRKRFQSMAEVLKILNNLGV